MIKHFLLYGWLPALLLLPCCNSNETLSEGVKIVHFPGTEQVMQSISYHKGRRNGPFIEYYRNGHVKAKSSFVNDTLNDTSAIYFPDGRLQSLHVYKNKLKHGCWKEYNKDGKLVSEIFLKEGLLDSTSTVYTYRTGRVLTRITYSNGSKNGTEEHYYSNGKPRSKAWYEHGSACMGTEEWYDDGKKINNDFGIHIAERNETQLKNVLSYVVTLDNPKPDDVVYQVMTPMEGRKIGAVYPLKHNGNSFLLEFNVPKGGFVMEKVTLAAYRKTGMGNTYIKTTSFNASSNNF